MSNKKNLYNNDRSETNIITSSDSIIATLLKFLHNEDFTNNLGHSFSRQNDIKKENSIMNFINNYADLTNIAWDGDEGEINKLINNKEAHWNKSYQEAWKYFNTNFKNIDENNFNPWKYDDLYNSDAAYDFSENYVKPQKNIDERSYTEVRGISSNDIEKVADFNELVAKISRHLQFTNNKSINAVDSVNITKNWLRLIMPTNARKVEIEDLNRNFWVIANVLAILCKYLFDTNSPISQMFEKLLEEITETWENILFQWIDLYMLYGRKDNIMLILDLPNNPLYPHRKFDNYDINQLTPFDLTKKFNYLIDKYSHSNISVLVRVRKNNYYYNYYNQETYPYYGFYDGTKWTWLSIQYGNDTLVFNPKASGYTNKIYGMSKTNSNTIKYGAYDSTYPIAALRIVPQIIQGGINPILSFTVRDAIGEMINELDVGYIVKQYNGTVKNNHIEIKKEEDGEEVRTSGKISVNNIKTGFYPGECATCGLTEVIE